MDCNFQRKASWPFACALSRATSCGLEFNGDPCNARPTDNPCLPESFSFLHTCENLNKTDIRTWFFGGSGTILSRAAVMQAYTPIEKSLQLEKMGHVRLQQSDAALNQLLYESGLMPTIPSITDCSSEQLSAHVDLRVAPQGFFCRFGGTNLIAAAQTALSFFTKNVTCEEDSDCKHLKLKVSIHMGARGPPEHVLQVIKDMKMAFDLISNATRTTK